MMNRVRKNKLVLTLLGAFALVWFLIRVIPKPSRAAYPCQRIAFPIASAFVLWLAGLIGSTHFFRKAVKFIRSGRTLTGTLMLITAVFFFLAGFIGHPALPGYSGIKSEQDLFVPSDDPNDPMGTGRGIHPGRVVWVYDPDATSFDGTTGKWFYTENNDQDAIDALMERSILLLAGGDNIAKAWDTLFRYFNAQHNKPGKGYQSGEKIAIKINMNTQSDHGSLGDGINTSPQMTLALARQLINNAGVPESDITFYEVSRYIPSSTYDPIHSEFPGIRFADRSGGDGRLQYVKDPDCPVDWSEELTLENGGGNPTFLPTVVSEADYLINLGNLKGHDLAGISICAKNHVGTIISYSEEVSTHSDPKAAGIHPYATVHDFHLGGHWNFDARPMGTYNTLTDMMGHKDLGMKTLLFIVDALYATRAQHSSVTLNEQWVSEPFNGDWTSSILVSMDGVALESVSLDFLRSEPTQGNVYGNVDNYLHEAAMAHDLPSGTFYDPEGDGVRMASVGVHEHWNNALDKQYTRNLGTGAGIELISFTAGDHAVNAPSALSLNLEGDTVLLRWTDESDNETGFVIEKKIGHDGTFEDFGYAEINQVYFRDSIMPGQTDTWYRIYAEGENGPSSYSREVMLDFEETASPAFPSPELKIYPNPASGYFFIRGLDKKAVLKLYNGSGQLIRSWKHTGHGQGTFSVSGLEKGMYHLQIDTENDLHSKKLLIQ